MQNFSRNVSLATAAVTIAVLLFWWSYNNKNTAEWSADEIKILKSLSIKNLPPLAKDTSNIVADNLIAAELGKQFFFDERFSHNSKVSCATCHIPKQFFTDGLTTAAGAQAGVRNTPTLVGTAYSPWQFWDGRSDSQWAQALAPLENDLEHAGSRNQFAHIIFTDINYRQRYEELFGPLPDLSDKTRFPENASPISSGILLSAWQAMNNEDQQAINTVFVNMAKALAAYQRLLIPSTSRFDVYIEGLIENDAKKLASLNKNELVGLKLFIGKAQCINCHNGPLLTNNEFHNTGILSAPRQLPSLGRAHGVRVVLNDPFNCQGEFSDRDPGQCDNLRFVKTGDELIAAQKVPTLRNVADTAPYMHAGQLSSLQEVIEHYDQAPLAMIGHNESKPLELSRKDKKQLAQFLHSLSGTLATEPKWLVNPHL